MSYSEIELPPEMTMTPTFDRVMVLRDDDVETETKGGIVIPEASRAKALRGVVVSVGEGKITKDGNRIEPDLKKGDHVMFGRHCGTLVTINEKEYMILHEEDVLAVIEDDPKAIN